MAHFKNGKWHYEVWDVLCPKCLDLFWQEPRSVEKFFTGLCCDCELTFIKCADILPNQAMQDFYRFRVGRR